MFKYAYNLDTERLVIQTIACMIKFIRYFRYFLLCFGRHISNAADFSLLFNILLINACSVHFKTHSSNDMSTCGLDKLTMSEKRSCGAQDACTLVTVLAC